LKEHSNCVNAVRYSKDGKLLVSGSDDNSIIVWNVEKGNSIKTLNFHSDSVWRVGFTNNEKYLMSAGKDKSCKIINWRENSLIQ
jgi:WD40 repeat protein